MRALIDKGENCWVLPTIIDNTRFELLVDSGASKSLVDTEVFKKCFPAKFAKLHQPDTNMWAANDTAMKIDGEGEVLIEIGSKKFCQSVAVTNLGNLDGILGNDFLKRHNVQLNLGDGIFKIEGWSVFMSDQPRKSIKCRRVKVHQDTVIPSKHELTFSGYVKTTNTEKNSGIAYLENVSSLTEVQGLMLAKALVNSHQSDIPVTFANLTDEPVTLRKGTTVALLSPVMAVEDHNTKTLHGTTHAVSSNAPTSLPDHLQPMLDNSKLNEEQKFQLQALLLEYSTVFTNASGELGKTDLVKHRIDTAGAKPVKSAPYRHSKVERDIESAEIDKMLKQGIIEPSTSPWASPVVLVKKRDGTTRFCVDYRKLNALTLKDAYPLPRIEETIDALSGSQWFCTVDAASGYWQVAMADEDKEKTAFATKRGLFQFTVMPFGLCNAPSTFERLMELILQGLHWERALVYIDDVLIYGKTFTQTLSNLKEVFQRLQDAGIKLKPSKCNLFQESVSFLGHVVGRDGVSCDPQKVEAVVNWRTPKSVKDVRSFAGLAGYYRKFISGFSAIAAPMIALTRKNARFVWTEECEVAFQTLKDALVEAPVLSYPAETGEWILDTDASDLGIGAALSQIQNGEERVIAYASRALSKTQKPYCTTYKELLAVRMFVEHFRPYIYGKQFTVRTDHASLTWLRNFHSPEGMVQRWIAYLDTFNIKWVHRKGELHVNADSLSRHIPKRKCNYSLCPDCGTNEEDFPCECMIIKDNTQTEILTPPKIQAHIYATQTNNDEELLDNWLGKWTMSDMAEWQREDPDLQMMFSLKDRHDEKPPFIEIKTCNANVKNMWALWSEFHVEDSILYRKKKFNASTEAYKQYVVPSNLKSKLMRLLHNNRIGGHLGVTKTLQKIKQRFYWVGCKQDVKRWCKHCVECAQKSGKAIRAPMQHIPVGLPLEKVAMDVMGPFPASDNGNTHILVISDYFTRWVEAYPIPDQTSQIVADKFVTEFISSYGIPEQIHADKRS